VAEGNAVNNVAWFSGGYDRPLAAWAKNCFSYELEIVLSTIGAKGFLILPHLWAVGSASSCQHPRHGLLIRRDKSDIM